MVRLLDDLASLFGGHDEMVRIANVSRCSLCFMDRIGPKDSSSTRRSIMVRDLLVLHWGTGRVIWARGRTPAGEQRTPPDRGP